MKSNIVELNKNAEKFVLQAGRAQSAHRFSALNGCDFVPLTFVHLSDIHNSTDLWGRMVDYINHYEDYISFAVHTGDYCGGTNAFYTDMYKECTPCVKPVYNCPGNHDCVTGDDDWTSPCDKSIVHGLLYNHTENWNVNFMDCEYPMSYYKDFEESNIRFIVLDLYYDIYPARVWLKKILDEACEKGLHVVTAMHEPTGYIVENYGVKYHHYDDYEAIQKLGEYNRETPAFDYRGRILFEDIIEMFIKKGGKYICNFAGHDHIDSFGYTQRGILNVVVQNATDWDLLGDSRRVKDTKSYDCFNVVGIDVESGVIKIIRIGNNVDRYMREKNVLCFDYVNKKVISEM